MAGASDIEWTDVTWNPIAGCEMVSAGCTNCYAMRMAARLEAMGLEAYQGTTRKSGNRYVWTGKFNLNTSVLEQPVLWKKPRRIFANSMSDLFQDGVPDYFIKSVWDVMARSPQHQFQILTKRPDHMAQVIKRLGLKRLIHVWLGTSIESADVAHRLEALKKVPAAIRFISFEPLLGSVGKLKLKGIDWAIVGGESGPHARPMNASWVDEIHAQCDAQEIAFFFKQWGGKNKKATGRTYRGRTWDQFPVQLAV